MIDVAAVVSVQRDGGDVEIRAVAAGQSVVLRLGLAGALSLADELTIVAHTPAVRAAA